MLSPTFIGDMYLKLPKLLGKTFSGNILDKAARLNCPREIYQRINITYPQTHENGSLKVLLWFATVLGGLEIIFIFLGCCFMFRADQDYQVANQGYSLAATGFKRFTYAELKKATCGFTKEIGRGGGGIVYKGKLYDQRVAAIKQLHEPNRVEAEFLAEVSTIGRFNHMNMIELWGYCAEGKHRLLVYEFMKHGSLANNLSSNTLNWEKRLEIALGTARGLCYLHEECLKWLQHCDIKPQNILLDADYNPKVADFGLSKLLNRSGLNNSSFSRIRGTRGYMAPEWVYNLPITSKVDVYSYGIVVLDKLTGKSLTGVQIHHSEGLTENGLVTWVKEKMDGAASRNLWIEEIVDPMMGTDYDRDKIELLVKVALQCAEQDASARPTMKQVLQMLLCHEDDEYL